MSFGAQFQIAYMMFREWLGKVFGSGVEFFQPTAPGYSEGYVK